MRVGSYSGEGLDTFGDQRWTVKINIHTSCGGWLVKMSVPHCFDSLIGAKPKHPWVGLLSQAPHPVDEVAPPSQIPGLNLTQLNEIGTFRPNPHQFLDRWSTRACRARALQNWVVCHKIQIPKHRPSSLKHRHKLSNVIPFIPTPINRCENMLANVPGLIEQPSSHPTWHWSLINQPPQEVWILIFTVHLWSPKVSSPSPLYESTLFRSVFISPDEDLLFEVETSWVNFFASFSADNQSNSYVSHVS